MGLSEEGRRNPGFIGDDGIADVDFSSFNKCAYVGKKNGSYDLGYQIPGVRKLPLPLSISNEMTTAGNEKKQRQTWGNGLEFLMSCIAMSIGLGNVWRFPYTAYQNGGGAFLIPYIIVLFLVGKPFYYLEMIIGQFTSRSSVKMWSCAPGFRGVGWAQMFSMVAVGTYYCFLMAITLYYLVVSFQAVLPWSKCLPDWGDSCVDSGRHVNGTVERGNSSISSRSSAELYFTKTVLNESLNIEEGIGLPSWKLVICLFIAWACIFGVLVRGVKSSGKAAYFLALFPYVIMISLLIRAVTLEGAVNGIIFFIKPNWNKLFDPAVWYAAVTQCFFSLSVCFGGLVTYSSYNDFRHNIYKDVIVVTTLDTITSLLSGFTIFGILGNLAHELGTDDIGKVVLGGSGLAFISYPDAIAKFSVLPQLFSALFFLMLYVLGIGSGIALAGGIISIVSDQFPSWRHWHIVFATSLIGFATGIVYCTPGGQLILNLIDYYAASFVVFILATLEATGVFWVYGLENVLDDVEFMLKKRPSIYWRLCWGLITPLLLAAIFVYIIIDWAPLTYGKISYPSRAHVVGWILFAFGILQVPFWLIYTILQKRHYGMPKMIAAAFRPSKQWGPIDPAELTAWRQFKDIRREKRKKRKASRFKQFLYVLMGFESKLD